MKLKNIADGVYPVMLTPFNEDGTIDYDSLIRLTKWYEREGANGLFAICQSSEIFTLTIDEKIAITKTILENTSLPVVASGNTQNTLESQIAEMRKVADTGVESVVLLTNMFANEEESDDILITNLSKFIDSFDRDVPLGLYECPYPYKRLLSKKVIEYILSTGRFIFLKDTSCDINMINERLSLIKGSNFKLYNAHAFTLIDSLKNGASGYSGIHANFSTKLMSDIYCQHNMEEAIKEALDLMAETDDFASNNLYPVCAKELMVLRGIFNSRYTRVKDHRKFSIENTENSQSIYAKILTYEGK
ncbi:MAG: dihydrodipicolinate synthase family protein [Clostridia bacterium]|nr:dihydrodipicolinate synthase family protein [Clostridia bacterium]